MIQRESIEDALENDRCGICGSIEHFREDCDRDQQQAAEVLESAAKAHAYYCTHAPVAEIDRLIVRYQAEHPAMRRLAAAEEAARWRAKIEALADEYERAPEIIAKHFASRLRAALDGDQ